MVTPAPSPAKAKATPNSPSSSSATTPANARGTAPATAPEASADTPAGTAQPKNKRKKLIRERGKRGGVKNKRKSSTSATASAPADASKTKANAKAGTAAATEHAVRIAAFHTLEKELARTSEPGLRAQLLAKQEKLGGLESYQDASLKGGDKMKGGESGKWCAQVFKEIRGDEPIRLLDVGAIAGSSYAKWPWIETTSIDLNPRAPRVLKYDFFDYPLPETEDEKFDAVGLSLVINFIGDLKKRGDILIHAHQYLKPQGYLYIVLPLPCVNNSRYLTHERFSSILSSTGWETVRQDDSKRLTRWLVQRKKGAAAKWDGKKWKKEEVLSGIQRNNFCITLG